MGNGLDCAGRRAEPTPAEPLPVGRNTVEIAASALFQIPMVATAYHTSVLVNDEEFFFSDSGICYDKTLMSHPDGKPSERFPLGRTNYTGAEVWWALDQHFRPGSYDLLRKNCNSFSDCALYFLLRKRLDTKYMAAERIGRNTPSLLEQVTGGMYKANPTAADFDVESVITALQKVKIPSPKEMAKARSSDRSASSMRPGTGPLQMSLPAGTEVQILGLKNAPALNGQIAKIIRYNGVTGRLEAQIVSTGEIKAIRADNLRPIGESAFAEGDKVRIDGLKSDAGQVLNGKQGVIKRYLHEAGRYEVEVEDDVKSFKPGNLQPW
mmetsp:Transcript_8299/g.14300  ORF Transcript_8299/g.14300 Transcript_8299/m.14300 type:complete len:323 (-) Transcript_8299:45-1013(-)